MRYRVRNEHGELGVPSYRELRTLYERSFISDDDEICREGSGRWVRAGDMQDLAPLKPRPLFHGLEFAWLALAICIGTLIMLFLFPR